MNSRSLDDFCIVDIGVISGIRPRGRTTDNRVHGRKTAGILYIWSGEARFYRDGRETLALSEGELLFLPKGMKYRMEYSAPSTTYVLINFETVDKRGAEISLFDDITVLAKEDGSHRITKAMANFEICSASKTIGATLRKKELMYRLLGWVYAVAPHLVAGDEIDSKILEGVRLLEQTYLENFPITTFADACHLSVGAFRHLFQRQFGTSPVKYRNVLRIERAKELLYEGDFSTAEVAYASGFENVGYFCRTYRHITGETPRETKRRNREN